MPTAARDLRGRRPHLTLVTDLPAPSTPRPRRRQMIGLHTGAFLGFVAEGSGQLAGLTFVQDLVITAVPVVGSMVIAMAVEVRRRTRSSHAVSDAKRLDEEYHRDLRRQIARLEKQVDDLARKRGGRPLRGDGDGPGAA